MRLEKYNGLDDAELMALVANDVKGAFDEIYHRYWEILVKTAYNVTQDKDVCFDCVQEVFVSLWSKRNSVEIKDLDRYLFRAVRLKVFEHLRRGNISQKHLDRMNFVVSSNHTEELINSRELNNQLKLSLSRLPDRCKEVFELSRFEQLANKDIAKRLNISLKTVEGHITKALKQLYADLGQLGMVFFLWF